MLSLLVNCLAVRSLPDMMDRWMSKQAEVSFDESGRRVELETGFSERLLAEEISNRTGRL